MPDIVIDVQNISKEYVRYSRPISLRQEMGTWLRLSRQVNRGVQLG